MYHLIRHLPAKEKQRASISCHMIYNIFDIFSICLNFLHIHVCTYTCMYIYSPDTVTYVPR